LLRVPPGAFRPPPKVDSAVVRLTPRAPSARAFEDAALVARIVKAAFGQRRKTLSNALANVVSPEQIVAAGIEPHVRAEQLAPAAFVALARVVGHAEMQNREPVAGNR
jgi:16S rRNA (adenine1518-N6/adenine1519-N6)-dimethyltransferase